MSALAVPSAACRASRTDLSRADQEHRVAELALVARAEATALYITSTSTLRGPSDGSGRAVCAYFPSCTPPSGP
jgi:hypothetical protein